MTQYDYAKAAATAARLLARYGQPITVTEALPGTYDPDTGTTTPGGAQIWAPNAVKLDYESKEIDGTNILVSDQRVLMQALTGLNPKPDAKLTIGGEVWRVVVAKPLAPAGVVVLLDVQVRK